jgi:hypothetical protein
MASAFIALEATQGPATGPIWLQSDAIEYLHPFAGGTAVRLTGPPYQPLPGRFFLVLERPEALAARLNQALRDQHPIVLTVQQPRD